MGRDSMVHHAQVLLIVHMDSATGVLLDTEENTERNVTYWVHPTVRGTTVATQYSTHRGMNSRIVG
jgi:hypothetical protein